ncbi:hypothetical protein QAD02_014494 [Eretmocerus hayati]|uniref:Uncharacterized protein n=1 Tax=Eretmocerus hayati TaxID=131215 RepID=A0ACC2P5Q5_9HYME|nr:hypothetical protein QAD02_014494 [Eretmocerus hayati]
MHKRCRAFPSEYQREFIQKRLKKTEPYLPIEHWESEKNAHTTRLEKNSEDLVRKLIVERYVTSYGLNYKDRSEEQRNSEEIDLGNELISYLKQLYYALPEEKNRRLPYTSTRLFGYASPQNLRPPLSDYQDTYGRTGCRVILRNIQKIVASKRRQKIKSKLLANIEP